MVLGLLIVDFICVSPIGAFGLLCPATSAATTSTAGIASPGTLLPVGLAVLVYETHLWLRGQLGRARLGWGRRRWGLPLLVLLMVLVVVGAVAMVRWGLVRDVGGGQGLHDLAVQDAERDTGDRVFEVVFSGQAVVEAGV